MLLLKFSSELVSMSAIRMCSLRIDSSFVLMLSSVTCCLSNAQLSNNASNPGRTLTTEWTVRRKVAAVVFSRVFMFAFPNSPSSAVDRNPKMCARVSSGRSRIEFWVFEFIVVWWGGVFGWNWKKEFNFFLLETLCYLTVIYISRRTSLQLMCPQYYKNTGSLSWRSL